MICIICRHLNLASQYKILEHYHSYIFHPGLSTTNTCVMKLNLKRRFFLKSFCIYLRLIRKSNYFVISFKANISLTYYENQSQILIFQRVFNFCWLSHSSFMQVKIINSLLILNVLNVIPIRND